tara:strand:- start:2705 stop:3217 length:513 start_codon:yes stop_codon:yes gene_type:complete
MKKNFEKSLELVLHHEGGYVNHPKDPGGETNLGVTKRVWEKWIGRKVQEGEMKNLTPEDVKDLYKKRYWDRAKCDDLPSGIDFFTFTFAVNSGPSRSAKTLQSVIGATVDGGIGPKTLAQLAEHNTETVLKNFHAKRQSFYEGLRTFQTFGKGWTRRNNEELDSARDLLA